MKFSILPHHQKLLDKIEEKSIPLDISGCWIWLGCISRAGYGRMMVDGTVRSINRLVWEIHHGPIPAGQVVRHRCDIPLCCNIYHLSLGSHQQNKDDMVIRDRGRCLTYQDVCDIRRIYSDSLMTYQEIGSMFGVVRSCISSIVNGRSWKREYPDYKVID